MLIFIDYFEVSNYGSGNSGTGSSEHASQHWRFEYGSLLTNNNPQFVSRWNQLDNAFDILYYYFLSKAKAYSLLAFCTAIAGVVLFVCRRKSSNIILGQTGLLLVMLFK